MQDLAWLCQTLGSGVQGMCLLPSSPGACALQFSAPVTSVGCRPFFSSLSARWQQFVGATTEDVNAAKSLQAAKAAPERVEQVLMKVENGSILAISWMPTLRFNPQWSKESRVAVGKVVGREGNRLQVVFANTGQRTPPMAFNTTFFNAFWPLPVPFLPPGISIEINSQELKGWLDLDTGEVDFSFVSEFGGKAFGGANEALKVASKMTTHALMGKVFHAVGFPLRELDSRAQLVALSSVPETGDKLQNWILQLPTDALSVLNVQMQFVMAPSA